MGLNDISELFITAIMSALVADGQAGPNGLSTAQARFSAFTFEDKFTFAEPVSSESHLAHRVLRGTIRLRSVSSVSLWEVVALSAQS